MSDKMVRAWKDEDFRLSLTEEERAKLPENPAGLVELTDEVLDSLIQGGRSTQLDSSCLFNSCNTKAAALEALV